MKPVLCDITRMTLKEVQTIFGTVDSIKRLKGKVYAVIGHVKEGEPIWDGQKEST